MGGWRVIANFEIFMFDIHMFLGLFVKFGFQIYIFKIFQGMV